MFPMTKYAFKLPLHYNFSSATAHKVNYYKLLDLESGATSEQITDAYTNKTRDIDPKANRKAFNLINEAFVILTNSKARDAYDSLLKVKASPYYLSEPDAITVKSTSYLAERKLKTYSVGLFVEIKK